MAIPILLTVILAGYSSELVLSGKLPSNGYMAFAGQHGVLYDGEAFGTSPIAVTSDGGVTWTKVSLPSNLENCERLPARMALRESGVGSIILGYNCVLVTTDFGLSWRRVALRVAATRFLNLSDITYDDDLRAAWLVGCEFVPIRSKGKQDNLATAQKARIPTLFVSHDKGITWERVQSPAAWGSCGTRVILLGEGKVLISAGRDVYRTDNGGRVWTKVTIEIKPYAYSVVAFRRIGNVLWLLTSEGDIAQSLDGGDSWSWLGRLPNMEGAPMPEWMNYFEFQDSRQGWLLWLGGRLLRTEDGGGSWSVLFPARRFSQMSCSTGSSCFVADGTTLYRIR